MASIPILNSIDIIRKQYPTGEEPVLVMCSDMNRYICKYKKRMQELHGDFDVSLSRCRLQVNSIIEDLPSDWGITAETVSHKLKQLFELDWVEAVWNNFEECLNENI